MRNNNLAYHADDRYRKIYDNREIRKITKYTFNRWSHD